MHEVAAAIGTSANRVCDWENDAAEPKLSTLARYGAFFGLTVSQLLDGVM
jgi:transcriptional regulator with XRE-family HTH domain